MRIKPLYILSLLLLVALLLACTSNGNKSANKNDTAHLNVGVMSSMDYLPLAVAKDRDFFEQEGVSVTIHKFYSANERDASFRSASLDGTILDYTGAAIQRAGGVDLKLASQCDGTFVLIAGEKSGVNSVDDLLGKSLAVSRNTVIDFCTDFVLEKSNIASSNIEKVEINKIPLRLEMLRSGKIDATMLPDPFATIALEEGGGKSVIDIKELDLRVTGIAFHSKVISKKEAAIKSFYRAYNQAIEVIVAEQLAGFYELLITEIGFPKEFVPNIQLPNYTKAQTPQQRDLEKVNQWLKDNSLVPANFDINTLVATELLP